MNSPPQPVVVPPDLLDPMLRVGSHVLLAACAAYCIWSASRHSNLGVLLFGITCVAMLLHAVLSFVFDPIREQPLLTLSFATRYDVYRLVQRLDPFIGALLLISGFVLARRNLRDRKKA